MSDEMSEEEIGRCPQATSVQVFFCNNPRCHRPHVVLKDENGKPFAQFVMPDYKPGGFMDNLQDAIYRSSVERDR